MARTSIVLGVLVLASYAAFGLFHASARTTDATMSMTVSTGGTCVGSTCTVPLSGAFTVQINAVVPPAEGYIGIQTEVEYTQLVASGGRYKLRATASDEIAWVDSAVFELRMPAAPTGMEGLINNSAASGYLPPIAVSNAAGALVQLDFNCGATPSSNVITLVPLGATPPPDSPPGYGGTNASGYKGAAPSFHDIPAKIDSTLTIVCGVPGTPPPLTTPDATATPTPTPAPLLGDANCDDAVSSIDALFILQFHARLLASLPCQENADVNRDGLINSIDAALIIQFGVGPCLPLPDAAPCLF